MKAGGDGLALTPWEISGCKPDFANLAERPVGQCAWKGKAWPKSLRQNSFQRSRTPWG